MHFFSPAQVMRLLEVVRAARTAPEALATAIETGKRLGKLPVTVGVCFGFVGNRLLFRRTLAADRLLLEGVSPQRLDAALTAFGFRMGPCAMADLAGLDISWRVRRQIGVSAPAFDALVEAGRLGQKTGKGFYAYPEGARSGVPGSGSRGADRRRRCCPRHSPPRGGGAGDPGTPALSDGERRRPHPRGGDRRPRAPTSMWCGCTATAGRPGAAGLMH